MYPTNFNLYRCSRGIKEPAVFKEIEKRGSKNNKGKSWGTYL